ncbi:MAG: two-component system, NtrC family, sensor histidine kinase HupT/HoxJ [Pseudomonadota bacterium]|nr:two-component system, NtrC family, sensor histidine kinase HupT/HoxJ [Pseudomonadota bacterium]MDQ5946024.1 two-component system, NtrC family, sensor histidine kinase HupT/HoxJ [Pseudomonadota bacterium]
MSTSSRPAKPAAGTGESAKPRKLMKAAELPAPAEVFDGVGEAVWIDVIRKMDEVYNDLLQYEVALEEKNAALEESHQFIESVLSSMSDILIVCDRHGNIEEVNASLQRFTGKQESTLSGTPVFDLFADEGSRNRVRDFFSPQQRGATHDVELMIAATDGIAVPVSINCTPRLSGVGKLVGMVVTGRPVGDLRRAYHALRQAHDELKRTQQQLLQSEKMASLGRLVAGVAHELNNPISFVLGNVMSLRRYATRLQTYIEAVNHCGRCGQAPELGQLRQELRIDRILEDMSPLLDGMIEGAERTRDIVDGLKRFSAIDRHANESFNLSEIIETAVRWVSRSAPPQFEVVLDLPPALPMIGASGQMQQVVMNLVQNACDATATQPSPRLSIRGELGAGEVVVLRFADNGPGIPPEHLPRLFDPFFTTKPVGQGTGLGLSISYGIVERHGGKLEAANGPDGGAVFTLVLPLTSA